jgi:hypothetical protein
MNQNKQIISLLILLQAISTFYLWSLSLGHDVSGGKFAVFLAVDLMSFAAVAYISRKEKWEQLVVRGWVLAAAIWLAILMLAGLFFL